MSVWAIPVLLLRSVTAGVRPASLADGQIFINQADGVMCWPNSNGGGSFSTFSMALASTLQALTNRVTALEGGTVVNGSLDFSQSGNDLIAAAFRSF